MGSQGRQYYQKLKQNHDQDKRSRKLVSNFSLVLLALSTSFCGASGVNSEGLVLLAFKRTVLDDPTQALQNWNSGDTTPCSWSGIRCNADQRVEQVSLARLRLVGTLNGDLGNLKKLQQLNLHDNQFFGPIPSGLFDLPELKSFYLFNNNLSGILPQNINKLISLQHLDISGNAFVGGIPSRISSCRDLQSLSMSGNAISGPIPEGLGDGLRGLRSLDLSSNQLDGEIPADFGNLISLQGPLNLSNNHFTGAIPSSLGNLPTTASLDLSNNNLTGSIPSDGTLRDQSPSAFQNNPGLCGPPLATTCTSSPPPSSALSPPTTPPSSPPREMVTRKVRLSSKAVIAIVIGDSVGIVVIVLVFIYFVRRRPEGKKSQKGSDDSWVHSSSECSPVNYQTWGYRLRGCCPVSKEGSSEASERVVDGELVRLDEGVRFNLDELLRASACMLGKNGVGMVVYKALLEEGIEMAVRRLGEGGTNSKKEFEREVQLIGSIRHPNIVSLRAYYWAVDEKLLIHDFVPNGSLASALHGEADAPARSPLKWKERLRIARGAAQGLAHIHAHKLVHNDIKSSNILLESNLDARISDLGLTRLQILARGSVSSSAKTSATESLSSGSVATIISGVLQGGIGRRPPPAPVKEEVITRSRSSYYPPEAAQTKQKPTEKWDVYSFGVLLMELLTGRSPAMHLSSTEMDLPSWVRNIVEDGKPISEILDPRLRRKLSKFGGEYMEALQIALICTEPSPEERPTMRLVSHSLGQLGRRLEICVSE
ncbi:hypothetical protein R1flu_022017 [Riccia fluitans]|uniref:Protein kinase domain-containing protein n=1 Tax=Riccia fluitans TaxID=41844 RepID=A0ABD1ZTY5_9MARC